MIQLRGQGNVHRIVDTVTDEVLSSGMSCELVGRVAERQGDTTVFVLVFEKYFMRASNRVSLTLTFVATGTEVSAYAIGSGGGQGPVFKMSWGAEEDFAITAVRALERCGFRVL